MAHQPKHVAGCHGGIQFGSEFQKPGQISFKSTLLTHGLGGSNAAQGDGIGLFVPLQQQVGGFLHIPVGSYALDVKRLL